jgi:hypothetical protein
MSAALSQLRDVILRVQRATDVGSEQDRIASAMNQSALRLGSQWRSAERPVVSRDYLDSVQSDITGLDEIAKQQVPAGSRQALNDILRDLETKERFASSYAGATSGFPDTVEVTVRTLRSNTEVSGYLVRCNPSRYANSSKPFFVFSSASSPTSRSLPPGYYRMWIEDAHGATVGSQPVTIGLSTTGRDTINFPLP